MSGIRTVKADFLAISPNNRIPAMVDHDPPGGGKPISVFESGAMLIYLGEKTGKFLPKEPAARADVMQWTAGWRIARSSPASIPSPTWQAIRGSCRTSGRGRRLRISRI
jgi:glutathione S-transferase